MIITFSNGEVQPPIPIDIPSPSTILDPTQYTLNFDDIFSNQLDLALIDPAIINYYMHLGISLRISNQAGAVQYMNTYDQFLNPNTNMSITSLNSGELYNIDISFMTSGGLMIINNQLVAP